MLVLSRFVGQTLKIGDEIVVHICDVRNKRGEPVVRIGIDAPRDVSIVRTELLERDEEEAAE